MTDERMFPGEKRRAPYLTLGDRYLCNIPEEGLRDATNQTRTLEELRLDMEDTAGTTVDLFKPAFDTITGKLLADHYTAVATEEPLK
jgi:hypothetical protein